MTNVC